MDNIDNKTKEIVDQHLNTIIESCESRSDDPELQTYVYLELIYINKLQNMTGDEIKAFIDSVTNMLYHFQGSKYHQRRRKEIEQNLPFFSSFKNADHIQQENNTRDNMDIFDHIINDALSGMKDAWYYKILFRKYYLEKHSYSDISRQTNISRQSIFNAVRKALERILRYIRRNYGDVNAFKRYLYK